jgi:TPR repeat protein
LQWTTLAAQQGNLPAQETLAIKYYFGNEVPRNYAEAVKWVRLAADGGSPLAREVALSLRTSRDPAASGRESMHWLRLGAARGNPRAQELLGVELYEGETVPRDLEQAVKLLLPAAEKGMARSQYVLGRIYASGEGTPPDYAEAIAWLEKAAGQGFADAQHEIGWMYAHGRGVPENAGEAGRWLRLAAAQNHTPAKSLLWSMAESGRTTAKNIAEMNAWLQAAATTGNGEAQLRYGRMLLRKEGVPRHLNDYCCFRLAAFWFHKAARQGRADAQYQLALMNLNGQGDAIDCRAAFIWSSLAAAQGHKEAARLVEECLNCLEPGQQEDARRTAARLQAEIVNTSLEQKDPRRA